MSLAKLIVPALCFVLLGCVVAPAPNPYPPVPPLRVELIPPPPPVQERLVWQGGHWHWNGAGYVWNPGHYVAVAVGARWEPPHWALRGGAWVWVPGHWT